MNKPITKSSPEEGLDFACSLITDAISAEGHSSPDRSNKLLSDLCSYIQLRYVGEPILALEYLAGIGHQCQIEPSQNDQFWEQLRWVALELGVDEDNTEMLFQKALQNEEG